MIKEHPLKEHRLKIDEITYSKSYSFVPKCRLVNPGTFYSNPQRSMTMAKINLHCILNAVSDNEAQKGD